MIQTKNSRYLTSHFEPNRPYFLAYSLCKSEYECNIEYFILNARKKGEFEAITKYKAKKVLQGSLDDMINKDYLCREKIFGISFISPSYKALINIYKVEKTQELKRYPFGA